jgi:hypothetical protein
MNDEISVVEVSPIAQPPAQKPPPTFRDRVLRTARKVTEIGLSAGREILLTPADLRITDSIRRIGVADPANVQQIAASQLELLAGYHQIALAQSRRSFFWALVGSGVGLIFFVAAVAFALATGIALAAVIPLLSGAIVEIVAGIVFVLYGKTTAQLSNFHQQARGLTALPSGQ